MATVTNIASSGSTVGQDTLSQLSTYTMAQLAPYRINDVFIPITNVSTNTATVTNIAAN